MEHVTIGILAMIALAIRVLYRVAPDVATTALGCIALAGALYGGAWYYLSHL